MPYRDLSTKRERERERRRERYANDPEFRERVRETQRRWKANNPGQSEADKQWAEDNRDRRREQARARHHANPARYLWRSAYDRAERKGIPFSITVEDVLVPEVCPVLGVPFEFDTPFAPTLDRIKPELGYVPGNVQVISRRANTMKSDASLVELISFARWVLSVTAEEVGTASG